MSTWYRDIQPLQEPFDLGLDDAGRQIVGFNVLATKRPSATLLQDLLVILEAAGVGRPRVDMFASSLAVLPRPSDDLGPVLLLRLTGGTGPAGTHNDGAGAYSRPAVQVVVHGASWEAAETMARAAYSALCAVRNQAA